MDVHEAKPENCCKFHNDDGDDTLAQAPGLTILPPILDMDGRDPLDDDRHPYLDVTR